MRRACTALALLMLVAQARTARAGVRGDSGWSADGRAWGLCDAWILPDSVEGCRFFDTQSRVWLEVGRREALAAWRPWEEALEPSGTRPLIPVYPMQEQEDNPGPVRLSGRLVPSDDVVELWRLAGDISHGERGGEWSTIFDYSPDGLWLAVGAAHVDHETSANELFVEVRPVDEWLALAMTRLAIEKIASGRIRSGLANLAAARSLLAREKERQGSAPEPRRSPLTGTRYVDDDPLHSKTFVRWSTDGRTLCACEASEEITGAVRTRCRILAPPDGEWKPVLVNLVHTHCPGYGRPPDPDPARPTPSFAADGGFDGRSAAVSVYMTGGALGSALGSVLERSWEEEIEDRSAYPAWYHAVGLPSPGGKWIAVGFLEERISQVVKLSYTLEVRRFDNWVEAALAEIELYERTGPRALEDAEPLLRLPVEKDEQEPAGEASGEAGRQGCSVSMP
jgi:hypothetical protein